MQQPGGPVLYLIPMTAAKPIYLYTIFRVVRQLRRLAISTPSSTSNRSVNHCVVWRDAWAPSPAGGRHQGKRWPCPHSRIMIHQPLVAPPPNASSDIEIEAREILRMKGQPNHSRSRRVRPTDEKVARQPTRNLLPQPAEAMEYA